MKIELFTSDGTRIEKFKDEVVKYPGEEVRRITIDQSVIDDQLERSYEEGYEAGYDTGYAEGDHDSGD